MLAWGVVGSADAHAATRRARARRTRGARSSTSSSSLTSAVSLLAATTLVRDAHAFGRRRIAHAVAALCLVTVALAWTMTHTAFAFRYARLYYRDDAEGIGGVELPGKQPPRYFDFAYFAFTIGMCFQVSDVSVTSRPDPAHRPSARRHQLRLQLGHPRLRPQPRLRAGGREMMRVACATAASSSSARSGEGAQGRTFDGVDKRDGQPVAIKRFDVRGAASWKDVELAEREARVLQSLSHPKLPRYVDHFEEDGALYLVMEKIEGESLAVLRKRGVTLGEEDVVRLLRDASDVLDYLHGRSPPVIHRDLKPGNVIRRPDGSFAFVDFGAVRDKLRPEGGSTVVGTFGYMAPEQFQGRAPPGVRRLRHRRDGDGDAHRATSPRTSRTRAWASTSAPRSADAPARGSIGVLETHARSGPRHSARPHRAAAGPRRPAPAHDRAPGPPRGPRRAQPG